MVTVTTKPTRGPGLRHAPPFGFHLDLDAPVLPAYELVVYGRLLWRVWCKHCGEYHYHGAAEGHRIAHCRKPRSPYLDTGYNLALSGP